MCSQIGYRLSGSFYLKCESAGIVGFDLTFPTVYSTRNDAENFSGMIGLNMEKENGEIVLRLYEGSKAVETLKWDEWWKYRCYKQKERCRGKENLIDEDFEPHYQQFKDIFHHYVRSENVVAYPLEYIQYWLEPVEKERDFGELVEDIEPEKSLEEEFLTFTEAEEKMKFSGFFCKAIVRIDDLSSFLKFNREDYFKGKRFLSAKFEREVLTYEGLQLKNAGFVRFWKYLDGNYFKKIIGDTGIHTGYEFKYIKFLVVQDDENDEFYV